MDYIKLSKEISFALRHDPRKYGLELDSEGFIPVEQLLTAINEKNHHGRTITVDDLNHIIETSEKKRFEIQDDKIRAMYGHSVPMHISKESITPPDVLYHGTSHKAADVIMKEGLKPMRRQYVHLSGDRETAAAVGKRRDQSPVILLVDAEGAYNAGIKFYGGNDKVYLSDSIPAEYLTMLST